MTGHLVAAIGWTLLQFVWQGTLIGLATALLLRTLRGAAPQVRYLVACAGLLACLCWPAAELVVRLSGGAAAGAASFAHPGAGAAPAAGTLLAMLGIDLPQLVAAWAACALALSLRMAAGIAWIHRCATVSAIATEWERHAQVLAGRMGIRRAVRVRVTGDPGGPVTAGWLRPLILLPASLVSSMPPDLLHALLAHELAHVRRWDYPVNLVQNLIETVLFYHPAVWWTSRQVRAERELVADAIAAETLGAPRVLAEALAALDGLQAADRTVLAAGGGQLLVRIRALVRPQPRHDHRGATLAALCLALVAVAGVGIAPGAGRAAGGASTDGATRAIIDFSSCAKPEYPAASLAAEHTGTVTLAFEVDRGGSVVDGGVERSSGHALLDKAALDAITRCRFLPARVDDMPIASTAVVQYVWLLK
jgi:bla regulator protein BlaR1